MLDWNRQVSILLVENETHVYGNISFANLNMMNAPQYIGRYLPFAAKLTMFTFPLWSIEYITPW